MEKKVASVSASKLFSLERTHFTSAQVSFFNASHMATSQSGGQEENPQNAEESVNVITEGQPVWIYVQGRKGSWGTGEHLQHD
jgi:hypothetical protein